MVLMISWLLHKFLLRNSLQTNLPMKMMRKKNINDLKNAWPEGRKFNARGSSDSLKNIISHLNNGVGHDGIHSQFLKTASSDFLQNLASFYNACFIHCYIPCDLLKGTINPIPKGKINCTDSGNYRPVMQSSCLTFEDF